MFNWGDLLRSIDSCLIRKSAKLKLWLLKRRYYQKKRNVHVHLFVLLTLNLSNVISLQKRFESSLCFANAESSLQKNRESNGIWKKFSSFCTKNKRFRLFINSHSQAWLLLLRNDGEVGKVQWIIRQERSNCGDDHSVISIKFYFYETQTVDSIDIRLSPHLNASIFLLLFNKVSII